MSELPAAEHPNAALTRRVFAAFGKDAKAISAAFSRDIVWRVPGHTIMSGEYRGRREVVEFLRRTGLETDGTYRSSLHTVFANDDWAIAIYRAIGHRNGIDLDVDQAFVIRCEDGLWKEVTAVPLDSAFERFWAGSVDGEAADARLEDRGAEGAARAAGDAGDGGS